MKTKQWIENDLSTSGLTSPLETGGTYSTDKSSQTSSATIKELQRANASIQSELYYRTTFEEIKKTQN